MKKNDFSTPYATLSMSKVEAPKKCKKDEPKGTKYSTGKDLRGGKK